MKIDGDPPQWALDLIEQVCSDYNRAKPGKLIWRFKNRSSSSGQTHYGKYGSGGQRKEYVRLKNGKTKWSPDRGYIKIGAGIDKKDCELVLLHELGHWTAYRTKSKGHTVHFWKRAFELYQRYGVDMEFAFKREKNYKVHATTVYERYHKSEE